MVYYEPIPTSDGTSLTAPSNAEFRVFEVSDTARATPLELRTVAGTNAAPLVTTAQGVLPGVEVVSSNFSHIFKSGEWEWRRDSVEGIRKAAEEAQRLSAISAADSNEAKIAALAAATEVEKPTNQAVDEGIARANIPGTVAKAVAAQPAVVQAAAAAVDANPKLTQIEAAIPQVLSDAKAYADAGELAAIETSLGPKVIAVDIDGTPYYSPTEGTHRIYPDADGVPYFAENLWPSTDTDTNGAPVITF